MMLLNSDQSWKVRRECAEILGKIREPHDGYIIGKALGDYEQPSVKGAALEEALQFQQAAVEALAHVTECD